MLTRRIALFLAAAFLLIGSPALAGSPCKTKIKFTNTEPCAYAVSVYGNAPWIKNACTASQFRWAGGVILNPGADFCFEVKEGTYRLFARKATFRKTDQVENDEDVFVKRCTEVDVTILLKEGGDLTLTVSGD